MKFLITLCLAILTLLRSGAAFSFDRNAWHDFEGRLGSSDIQLSIYLFANGELKGNYSYRKYETKIALRGKLVGNHIQLYELIDNRENGLFNGQVSFDSPDRLEGEWVDAAHTKQTDFKLILSSVIAGSYESRYADFFGTTEEVDDFMKQVKTSILKGDKEWLASNICYPVRVFISNTKKITIHNRIELIRHFDVIFDNEFKEEIRPFYTSNLFTNARGAMLGSGQIWIDAKPGSTDRQYGYCIIAINN